MRLKTMKMLQTGILILTSVSLMVIMHYISSIPLEVFANCINTAYTNVNKHTNKPVFVIGIMSATHHTRERNAIRNTWLTLKSFTPFDIKYKFLIDKPTSPEQIENKTHGDILFLNCSSGSVFRLAEKFRVWFNYALKNYADAVLISTMDDDAYPCITKVFGRIFEVMSKNLYFGTQIYAPSGLTCIDDVFLVLGRHLVEQFVREQVCDNTLYLTRSCDYAHEGIAEWLLINRIHAKWVTENGKWIHFDKNTAMKDQISNMNFATFDMCSNYSLFHKSDPELLFKFFEYEKIKTVYEMKSGNRNQDNL